MEEVGVSPVLGTLSEEQLLRQLDQQNKDSDAHEFITVERRRKRFYIMLQASALCNGKPNLKLISEEIHSLLEKTATIIGHPVLRYLPKKGEEPECYIITEVGSRDQAESACQGGFKVINDDKSETKHFFQEYSEAAQVEQQEHVVRLKALAWNTKTSDIHAAMSRWGPVQSVTMGFNSKKTMANAVVVFKNATSVQRMLDQSVTWVTIAKDAGAVAQLGTQLLPENRALTKKLAHLPEWFTPLDVLNMFKEHSPARHLCKHVTMPVDPTTKRRHPEAFVYFSNQEDWDLIKNIVFDIEGKKTMWLDPAQPTCRTCGHPDHIQRNCPIYLRRKNLSNIRKTNSRAMQQPTKSRIIPSAMPPKAPSMSSVAQGKQKAPPMSSVVQGKQKATSNVHFANPSTSYSSVVANNNAKVASTSFNKIQHKDNNYDTNISWRIAHADMEQKIQELTNRLEKQNNEWLEKTSSLQISILQLETQINTLPNRIMAMIQAGTSVQTLSTQDDDNGEDTNMDNSSNRIPETQMSALSSENSDSLNLGPLFSPSQPDTSTQRVKRVWLNTERDSKVDTDQAFTHMQKQLDDMKARAESAENQVKALFNQNSSLETQLTQLRNPNE
ncbi:hypothetical protein BGZ76_004075 [Entomortierella beljakovae]|nr:hypothetical protein BGZ76_004075 [Entomortierella beljakovae]